MARCHIFDFEDAEDARKAFNFEFVKNYGSDCNNIILHTWDEGERHLVRCKKCGALVLVQRSEFHSFSDFDDYYTDYFPVETEEEAEEYNRTLGGFEIERKFKGKYLAETNGSYGFIDN